MEIVNYGKRNPNHVKFWILTFSARCERAQHARGHVRTETFEMLKMTWFVLKIVKKWFWAFLNFDVRVMTRTGTWIVSMLAHAWHEIYVYWIWSIYDEWLWRYEW